MVELQTDEEYQAALKELTTSKGGAIVDFSAVWCGLGGRGEHVLGLSCRYISSSPLFFIPHAERHNSAIRLASSQQRIAAASAAGAAPAR